MKDKRSQFKIYMAAAKRLLMWHFLAPKLQLVLVPEFPKSGGSWFCQMLSDASGLPFPRNVSPKFERSIMHGHHLFHPGMGRAIAVLRDGRDIMVSAYFHFLFENDRNPPQSVRYYRSEVDFNNYSAVTENMPRFIEYMFTGYAQKNMFHFSWSNFVENIYTHTDSICVVKYEELLTQPIECLQRALKFYGLSNKDHYSLQQIVDHYSFKKMTKRKAGEENRKSFIRKGISGDWKNYFSEESCLIFKKYAGNALVQAGYEDDLKWENPIFLNNEIK